MGQKTNPNIYRLSLPKKTWVYKHLEKTSEESSYIIHQNIQIKHFISRYFLLHGIKLQNFFIHRSSNVIKIFISYTNTPKVSSHILQKNLNKISYLKLLKQCIKKKYFLKKRYIRRLKAYFHRRKYYNRFKKRKAFKPKAIKKTVTFNKNILRSVKTTSLVSKTFITKFLTILQDYFFYLRNICIYFQNLNKGLSLRIRKPDSLLFRKLILKLRFYKKAYFFKDFVSIMPILLIKKKTAHLLSDYISSNLCLTKRHYYFLTFLKRALKTIILSKLSKLQGVRIEIKGRFNGANRARKRIINIGRIPLQTLYSNIDYSSTTSYTSNGTFGIKVFTSEKNVNAT